MYFLPNQADLFDDILVPNDQADTEVFYLSNEPKTNIYQCIKKIQNSQFAKVFIEVTK